MIEKIINDINYRLDEDNLTAEVMENEDYEGDIIIPETIMFNHITYRVTSIGDKAFSGCSSLTSIVIPDGVTSIGEEAFEFCSSLTSIVIPDSVTSIGDKAFDGCKSLKQKPIQEIEMKNINYRLLMHNHCAMVVGYSKDSDIINIPSEINHEGVIYRVTNIGDAAFSGCESLTSIVIPDSVTSIGAYAFYGCTSLSSIVIPDSVTSIGGYAFKGCSSLSSIVIPDSVTSIEDRAFAYFFSLTSIVIPDSVTSIGDKAFSYCSSLTSIVIPDSVTSIGDKAFYGCKSLTNITFQGAIAQWKEIEFGEDWNEDIPARVVHCTDGDVEI